ncbi:MAG TPA: nicotinate (nicotinamide) nucleotide adenylyltransferase [Bacteroidales bacterium]|jgi:nicotinate-nucleotide adenylyltransferase|nr:nicotinate (nicotinamide) nucleotide adenylyltransferase [Bacteroidales bacterium]HOU82986.1 nicotinate (nicotinamide) nucleotide adenylyltransferase [Bacteroidales bacterium]HPX46302.1 nicotinate (nicotinamide) nucleotide adenylyltransferase [Bacteroidales bacterium]HQC60456.1 nicotinate (nicotinamide) nucleotide adenylyltransferase [Bacteroidales bacterium]HRC78758.1 nicotinate (nicotinamide) nucleotide adenylyltransferase [Bacteroidales bacterium]
MKKQKNIGLLFGTFNPPHIGHTLIANYFYITNNFDEIWFIVSPQNPFKKDITLLNEKLRLEMVRLAIENANYLKASDIEFGLPKPSYTINTLEKLKNDYPQYTFNIIMGSDNAISIEKWKYFQNIIDNHRIYVYPRTGYSTKNILTHKNIKIDNTAPIIDISSTWIREQIKNGKDVQFFLRKVVYEFIKINGVYQGVGY